jgi:hypothetical protein
VPRGMPLVLTSRCDGSAPTSPSSCNPGSGALHDRYAKERKGAATDAIVCRLRPIAGRGIEVRVRPAEVRSLVQAQAAGCLTTL